MFVGRSENSVHVIVNNVQHIGIARPFFVPGGLISFPVAQGIQKIVCLRVAIGGSVVSIDTSVNSSTSYSNFDVISQYQFHFKL